MLEIKNLTYKFKKKVALNSVSISLEDGVYGLLGPNGSGKTTLIRCLTGIYPTHNQVLFNSTPISVIKKYSKNVGYLPQKFGMYENLTLFQMLSLVAELKEIDKSQINDEVNRVLELVNLQEEADKKVKALSGGMVRRAGIAQALLGDPKILIFDEPTTGLDPEERLRFQTILSQIKGNKIILLATHIVEDVQSVCDKIIILNDSELLFSGSKQRVSDCARDKTYILPMSEAVSLSSPYYTQKQYTDNGVEMLRINSSVKQDAMAVNPTVEDGYICIIKNI